MKKNTNEKLFEDINMIYARLNLVNNASRNIPKEINNNNTNTLSNKQVTSYKESKVTFSSKSI